MNYIVKAIKISMKGSSTTIEDYEKNVSTYGEAEKEVIRLKSLGEYSNIKIDPNKKPHL
jgi:phosphorylcholine metabolism protein LicD